MIHRVFRLNMAWHLICFVENMFLMYFSGLKTNYFVSFLTVLINFYNVYRMSEMFQRPGLQFCGVFRRPFYYKMFKNCLTCLKIIKLQKKFIKIYKNSNVSCLFNPSIVTLIKGMCNLNLNWAYEGTI